MKSMSKIISFILAFVLVFSTVIVANANTVSSSDINDRISQYVNFNASDKADLLQILADYENCTDKESVVGIERIQKASAALNNGAHFYDDFAGYTDANAVTDVYDLLYRNEDMTAASISVKKDSDDTNYLSVSIPKSTSWGGNAQLFGLKQSFLNGRTVKKISGKVYINRSDWDTNNTVFAPEAVSGKTSYKLSVANKFVIGAAARQNGAWNTSGNQISTATGWYDFTYEWNTDTSQYDMSVIMSEDNTIKGSLAVTDNKPNGGVSFGIHNSNGNYKLLKDISIEFYSGEYVDSLISALPELSAMQLSDEVAVKYAEKIYEMLSDSEKAKVTLKSSLDAAINKIQEIKDADIAAKASNKLLDFEDGTDITYFEKVNTTAPEPMKVEDTPFKDSVNDSDKVLSLVNNYEGSESSGKTMYKYYDIIHSQDDGIYTVSGKTYLKGTAIQPIIVYDFRDENNWDGIMLQGKYPTFQTLSKVSGKTISVNKEPDYGTAQQLGTASEEFWVHFTMKYTLTDVTVYISYVNKSGKTVTYNFNTKLKVVNQTRFALASNSANKVYFDDIRLCEESDDEYFTASKFISDHKYILNLFPASDFVSEMDRSYYESAIAAYNQLDSKTKEVLWLEKNQLDAAKIRLDEISGNSEIANRDETYVNASNSVVEDFDNLVIKDDFENGLSIWQPAYGNNQRNYGTAQIEYNEDFGSNVLLLNKGSVLRIKDILLPYKSEVQSISFKMKAGPKAANHYNWTDAPIILTAYDCYTTAYNGYSFHLENQGVHQRWLNSNKHLETNTLNMDDILNVSIVYSRGQTSGVLTVEDKHNNKWMISIKSDLDYINVIASLFMATYIDDFEMTLAQGYYDIDEENTDIVAYFTGNTWQKPDEIITLHGENLNKNVMVAYVMPIDDTMSQYGYISQISFDADEVKSGQFIDDPVTPTWNDAAAQKVDIVQKTEDSIKLKLPSDFKEGIYAVKLMNLSDEKIYYLNLPLINYTVGSDGEITAPGKDLRIIGKNLGVINDPSKIKVRIRNAAGYDVTLNPTAIQSDYSLSVTMPDNIANGTYELSVFNGYGDDTCWSIPTTFKVGTDIRSTWSTKQYNILDFGADTKSGNNDTPAFSNAISAISANGGGILYIPEGIYTLVSELVIPENISIIGEDKNKVTITFEPYDYMWGELPQGMFILRGSNIQIKNISFVTSRVGGVFRFSTEGMENIYIEDFNFRPSMYAGIISEGHVSNGWKPSLDYTTLQMLTRGETTSAFIFSNVLAHNVQLKNIDLDGTSTVQGIVSPVSTGKYWQCNNFRKTIEAGFGEVYVSYSLWENFDNQGGYAIGIWGNGTYFDDFRLSNNIENNNELFVADHGARFYGNMKAADNTGLVYNLSSTLEKRAQVLGQLYVLNGQGRGQVRTILSSKETTVDGKKVTQITIDKPFVVQPNGNSSIVIRHPREHIYFVDGEYETGGSTGFFGGACDVVYDNNTYINVEDYTQDYGGEANWYFTHNRCNFSTNGSKPGGMNSASITYIYNLIASRSSKCHIFKNSDFDNYVIQLSAKTTNFADIVFDNNVFSNTPYAFRLAQTSYPTGVILSRNKYFDVDTLITGQYQDKLDILLNNVNSVGSKNFIVLDSDGDITMEHLILGDVNGDGKVTLKDVTLIRFYVIGKVELSANMIKAADVDQSNTVNLKDATLIRMYILGKIESFDDVEVESSQTPSEPSQPDESEDADSSDTSSDAESEDEPWTGYY